MTKAVIGGALMPDVEPLLECAVHPKFTRFSFDYHVRHSHCTLSRVYYLHDMQGPGPSEAGPSRVVYATTT